MEGRYITSSCNQGRASLLQHLDTYRSILIIFRARPRGHLCRGPSGRIPARSQPGSPCSAGPLARHPGQGDLAGKAKPYSEPTDPSNGSPRRRGSASHHRPVVKPPVVFPPYPRQGADRSARLPWRRARPPGGPRSPPRPPGPRPLALLRHARRLFATSAASTSTRRTNRSAAAVGRLRPGAGPARRRLLRVPGPQVTRTPPALRPPTPRPSPPWAPPPSLLGRPPADAPPARRAPLGRALGFCGIYAAFDALMSSRPATRGPRPGAVRRQPALRRSLGRRRDDPLEPGAPRGEGPRRRPGDAAPASGRAALPDDRARGPRACPAGTRVEISRGPS